MSRRMLIGCLFLVVSGLLRAQTRLACWNLENFFDTVDDTLTLDDAFTPQGENHWTYSRFVRKRDMLYKTVAAMGYPALVGLVEVENGRVLDELCQGTPLRRQGYSWVHFDSPDRRGIDCALLYRSDKLRLLRSRPVGVSDTAEGFYTRDMLLVEGCLAQGDTLCVLVNHWPSRKGGIRADNYRSRIAGRLRRVMDSLHTVHPDAWVVAMGDFNAAPGEVMRSMAKPVDSASGGPLNLMAGLEPEPASYKYQGRWEWIDQILCYMPTAEILSTLRGSVFTAPWLLAVDERYMGLKPLRTYRAMVYLGGVSDHLPVYVDLP